MKSIWKGSISFGLVNIPVRLYSAIHDSSLDLDMLDRKDHAKIRFKRVNENTGREVPYENIVKGYLFHDDYVVLEDQDFEYAVAKNTNTIEITEFVDEAEIDPIYYEQPFYLEPEKGGTKAYSILRDALQSTNKVGIATFVLRKKESLAALTPRNKVIVLNRIRFEQEIRDEGELTLPPLSHLSGKEQQMAVKLINQLKGKFNISKFKDTYSARLLEVIKKKSKGIKVSRPKMKVVHSKSNDLVDLLKQSLAKRKKTG